jgi:membrane-associated phospholipid phosphatase
VNRKTAFYWLIAIALAGLGILTAFYFDEAVRSFIVRHQNRTLVNLMRNVSRFGDWPEHLALGLVLLGIACWRGSRKWTHVFLAMLIALTIGGVSARVVKVAAGRARPSVKTEEVWNGPKFSSKYNAFPSGHVTASTAFFAVLFFVNWRLGLACLPIPVLIGFSRMYVAAHYLSDVACAAILGILCALLVDHFFLRKIRNPQLNWRRG